MILELETDEVCRLLVYIESETDEIRKSIRYQDTSLYKAFIKNLRLISKLRRILGVTEYAAELDKLEAMEAQNDTGTSNLPLVETQKDNNVGRCSNVDYAVVGENIRLAEEGCQNPVNP